MCDIRRLGGEVAERLALAGPDPGPFRFDASVVPVLPPSATSESVVIARGHHDFNGCWRVDRLQVHAMRHTLRALGVIVLASLFAPPGTATDITLTHPASDIRTLRIQPPPWTEGLHLARRPESYEYWPATWHQFPWHDEDVDPRHLPAFYLTDHEEIGGTTQQEWLARDTVVGFGTQEGVARLGQLLLDVGNPADIGDEYHLECEAGIRGVAPLSAELSLWLPGSVGWDPNHALA
jgi:hypothetical protein